MITLPIVGSNTQHAYRLNDEYLGQSSHSKNRLCLHVTDGLADVALNAGHGAADFEISLPFNMDNISLTSDAACDTTPFCDVFDATQNPDGATPVPLPRFTSRDWQLNGGGGFVSGSTLWLGKTHSQVQSALAKGTLSFRDSWEARFRFTVSKGTTSFVGPNCCRVGHGDGFAFVLTSAARPALPRSWDVSKAPSRLE